jgi:protein SCO1/2
MMSLSLPLACSSCFFGEDAVRWAYYISAVVMFLLPIAMVSGSFRVLERIVRVTPGAKMNAPKKSKPILFAATLIGAMMIAVPFLQPDLSAPTPRRATGIPPILAQVGDFELRDQAGAAFGSRQLRGRVWIANFIFTRCPTLCPRVTLRMAEFEAATAGLSRSLLVSFSIDPEHDTSEVLARYAKRYGANEKRWHFLTGPFEEVKSAVEKGLNVTIADARHRLDLKKHQNISTVLHGTRFVLIDEKLQIRGYYDVKMQAAFDQLKVDVETLLRASAQEEPAASAPDRDGK